MKDCSSEDCGKKYPQKTLVECDTELETYFNWIEDAIFDREARNETLRSEEFHPPSGTLFEALFKELKRREKHESHTPSLSNTISLLRARVARAPLPLMNQVFGPTALESTLTPPATSMRSWWHAHYSVANASTFNRAQQIKARKQEGEISG